MNSAIVENKKLWKITFNKFNKPNSINALGVLGPIIGRCALFYIECILVRTYEHIDIVVLSYGAPSFAHLDKLWLSSETLVEIRSFDSVQVCWMSSDILISLSSGTLVEFRDFDRVQSLVDFGWVLRLWLGSVTLVEIRDFGWLIWLKILTLVEFLTEDIELTKSTRHCIGQLTLFVLYSISDFSPLEPHLFGVGRSIKIFVLIEGLE